MGPTVYGSTSFDVLCVRSRGMGGICERGVCLRSSQESCCKKGGAEPT